MANTLTFLSQYSTLVSLLFSGVVTAATIAYVMLTRELARETRELRRAGSEPRLSIFAEPSAPSVTIAELVIENVGAGAAYNVRFELHSDWQTIADRTLGKMALIRDGVRYMAPGKGFRFPIGMGPEIAKREQRSFEVTVRYESLSKEAYEERFTVSLEHFLDMTRLSRPVDQRTAEAIEKLAEAADKWSSGSRKLQVELWTQTDIRLRDEDLRAMWDRQQKEHADRAEVAIQPGALSAPSPRSEVAISTQPQKLIAEKIIETDEESV